MDTFDSLINTKNKCFCLGCLTTLMKLREIYSNNQNNKNIDFLIFCLIMKIFVFVCVTIPLFES